MPIGKLKLPSTREHILETTENAEILKECIQAASDNLTSNIQGKYQKLFDDEYQASSLEINIQNYYKFCTTYGYSPSHIKDLLYKSSSKFDIDSLGFLSKESFDGYRLNKSNTSYVGSYSIFQLLAPLSKDPNASAVQSLEYLFYYQDMNSSYKIAPKTYNFNPLHFTKQSNPLYIYADCRVPSSYVHGLKDIESYSCIRVIRPNSRLFEGDSTRIEEGYKLLTLITSSCNWALIKASEIPKPEGYTAGSRSKVTAQAFSHYKTITVNAVTSLQKIFKKEDAQGKAIPFGLEYIDLSGESNEVFYKLKSKSHWIPVGIKAYLKHYKINTIYVVEDSKEDQFLELFKDHEKIKRICNVDGNPQLDYKPLFDNKVLTLIAFYKIWLSCNNNVSLFKLLISNILTKHPHLTETEFDSLMVNINHYSSMNRVTMSTFFNSVSDYDLRSLINSISNIDPYVDEDILNSAYLSLDESTISDFISTCIPPALTNYINISIKER